MQWVGEYQAYLSRHILLAPFYLLHKFLTFFFFTLNSSLLKTFNSIQLKSKLNKLTVCSYHVTYSFQSKSTLCSCQDVKEILTQNWRNVWSLSDCNRTRTHNHLVCKWRLNHKLAKLNLWLSVRVLLQSLKLVNCVFSIILLKRIPIKNKPGFIIITGDV